MMEPTGKLKFAYKTIENLDLKLEKLEAENKALTARLESIQKLVNKQAEDEGNWFRAVYATEAFLQRELRELHTLIEDGE